MSQKTYLKIPRERVGVLIGPKGKAKRRIESYFGVTIEVESESGSVEITLNPGNRDVTAIFTVRNVVKAIGTSFVCIPLPVRLMHSVSSSAPTVIESLSS